LALQLAQKARGFEEIGRDPGEMLAAFLEADPFRQVVEDNGCDHRRAPVSSLQQDIGQLTGRSRRHKDRQLEGFVRGRQGQALGSQLRFAWRRIAVTYGGRATRRPSGIDVMHIAYRGNGH
jgi:hypothetical protein